MNLPIFSYQACSTAEKLSINEDISSPTKAEIIQKAREKYTIPLVLRFSPNFAAADKQQIIHRVGQKLSNLTDNQLFSVYLATDENRRDPVVLDLAHEHMDFGWTQSRPNHMWSKYVAGSIKEPNAQYERLKFAYLDAVNHKQYLHNQYNQMIAQGMLLPAALLIGQMRTTASLIENIQSQLKLNLVNLRKHGLIDFINLAML